MAKSERCFRILCVEWVDSISTDEWCDSEKALNMLKHPSIIRTIGMSYCRDEHALVLSQSWYNQQDGSDGLQGLIRIPAAAIVREFIIGYVSADQVKSPGRKVFKERKDK